MLAQLKLALHYVQASSRFVAEAQEKDERANLVSFLFLYN